MALTTTTLSSACGQTDATIVVASATSFAVGNLILIDQEVMQIGKSYNGTSTTVPVQRGLDGSVQTAHKATANVTTFLASDENGPNAQTVTQFPTVRSRRLTSVSATATLAANPGEDLVIQLNGTTAIPLTLTAPTKDMDGGIVMVVANGKAAHTITISGGIGAGGTAVDVGTFASGAQNCQAFIASNGAWVLLPSLSTTATLTTNTVAWA